MAIREVRAAAGKDVPKVDIRTTTPTSARLSTPSIVATAQAEKTEKAAERAVSWVGTTIVATAQAEKTEKAAERAVSWVGTTGDAHTFYR